MHIPDGVLSNPVAITTGVLAAGGVANGLRKIDYERIPRVAVLAAVFFVASLIHVPIGPSSAHLLLNGLMGFLIGWAAFPALLVALLLQAVFFGFGGVTSLGANVLNMAAPAIVVYYLFAHRISPFSSPRKVFGLAFGIGVFAILLTCLFGAMTLFFSGKEFVGAIMAIFAAHIPIMIIEGFVTGSVMVFLHRVRPELLRAPLLNVELEYEERVYA
jgi:cobalt/nickel transport system permease protein